MLNQQQTMLKPKAPQIKYKYKCFSWLAEHVRRKRKVVEEQAEVVLLGDSINLLQQTTKIFV